MEKKEPFSVKQKEELKQESFHSKLLTNRGLPGFTDSQLSAFKSDYVDSYDEALKVLDEDEAEKNPL